MCEKRSKNKQKKVSICLLLVSRYKFQVVCGCHINMSLQLHLHPLGNLCYGLVCGHKDTGNLCLDLQYNVAYVKVLI